VSATCDEAHWQAVLSYSDGSPTYLALLYHPGIHLVFPDKSQTYRVEGDNVELRHYLARRSRCFSCCLVALTRSIKLFVYAWNRRQLHKQAFPNYPAHLMDFAYPGI
jgi:IS1 family transposase